MVSERVTERVCALAGIGGDESNCCIRKYVYTVQDRMAERLRTMRGCGAVGTGKM